MKLSLRDSLLFVSVTAEYMGIRCEVPNVLVDTGSASTILATDAVAVLGIRPAPSDVLRSVRGVGGTEHVFGRPLERLTLGERGLSPFSVDIGGMDYGFEINGILGLDFLLQTGAILDLRELSIGFH